ncbi:PTS sugar transporter subunit IIA [Clostridium nigeriense]|uniref:PTS sugar transporter subunit IIA n=1 Tax=Clostridium nigeriense TaxID=1805470 RepID=UPI0008336F64|nr:PTS sugar transporter subunit IIA [Clostridium nigeriense]
MVKVLLATHGQLAAGLVNSAKMLIGDFENVDYISFHEEMGIDQLNDVFEEKVFDISEEKQYLILCDIIGGSPFNVASKFSFENPNVAVFYGINLPLLIEAIMHSKDKNLKEVVEELLKINKDTIGLSAI